FALLGAVLLILFLFVLLLLLLSLLLFLLLLLLLVGGGFRRLDFDALLARQSDVRAGRNVAVVDRFQPVFNHHAFLDLEAGAGLPVGLDRRQGDEVLVRDFRRVRIVRLAEERHAAAVRFRRQHGALGRNHFHA